MTDVDLAAERAASEARRWDRVAESVAVSIAPEIWTRLGPDEEPSIDELGMLYDEIHGPAAPGHRRRTIEYVKRYIDHRRFEQRVRREEMGTVRDWLKERLAEDVEQDLEELHRRALRENVTTSRWRSFLTNHLRPVLTELGRKDRMHGLYTKAAMTASLKPKAKRRPPTKHELQDGWRPDCPDCGVKAVQEPMGYRCPECRELINVKVEDRRVREELEKTDQESPTPTPAAAPTPASAAPPEPAAESGHGGRPMTIGEIAESERDTSASLALRVTGPWGSLDVVDAAGDGLYVHLDGQLDARVVARLVATVLRGVGPFAEVIDV